MLLAKKHGWTAFLILIILLVLYALNRHWDKFLQLFQILLISIIIAYILTPICDFLEKRMSRTVAIVVMFFLFSGLLAAFIIFFIPRMIGEALVLVERFPLIMQMIRGVLRKIQNHMETLGIPKGIQESVYAYADAFQKKATDTVMRFLERSVSILSFLPTLFIELVLGFYFLKDREAFGKMLANYIPLRSRKKLLQVASEINRILHSFIRGEVFIAATVGLLATAGYLLIGLPYALILGFIAGILEFIPYFGPWMGAIPAVVIAYLTGPKTLLWTLAMVVFIQQIEGVFITPRILGGVVSLHPVYIILSLWTGSLFFGVAGMFLAVPAVLILRVIIKHVYLHIVTIT